MQAGVGLLVADVMPIYMIIPRYSHNYAQFCQLLNSNLFTHRKYLCSWEKPLVKPMAPGSIFHHINLPTTSYFWHRFNLLSLLCIFIIKIPKILSYHIYQISRKWPWRDWQPLYCVGCEDFIWLCRCEGLVRGLLLDWYLGSQKLREILTLLCCITLSSSRENQRMLKR